MKFLSPNQLRNDRKGAIAINLAITMPLLIAFLAVGIDIGIWYHNKRQLQTEADAAALAAAYILGDDEDMMTAALAAATANGFDTGIGTISVESPPESGVYTGDDSAVAVELTETASQFFSAAIFGDSVSVRARGVAYVAPGAESCVLALDPDTQSAIRVYGNTTVSMEGCIVTANSCDDEAITLSGNSELYAPTISMCGGYDVGGAAILDVDSAPITGSGQLDDPY
ncbi:MAG: pilus assembly protein TadG-related protein, partial [Pseudomonadota bacterium]|nr:pilus assembly protein TadG-related protein [Pseudomonadota bacterium]